MLKLSQYFVEGLASTMPGKGERADKVNCRSLQTPELAMDKKPGAAAVHEVTRVDMIERTELELMMLASGTRISRQPFR